MWGNRLAARAFAPVACIGLGSWTAFSAGQTLASSSVGQQVRHSSKSFTPLKRYRVGVLGATGAVGQRFVQYLEGHPWFEVVALGASERSAGKPYAKAVNWGLSANVPQFARDIEVVGCMPSEMTNVDAVFSALVSEGCAHTVCVAVTTALHRNAAVRYNTGVLCRTHSTHRTTVGCEYRRRCGGGISRRGRCRLLQRPQLPHGGRRATGGPARERRPPGHGALAALLREERGVHRHERELLHDGHGDCVETH